MKKVLKSGECLTFDTQEQFNLLCQSIDVPDDSIVIDGMYCCYLDFQGVPDVQPVGSLCEDLENFSEALLHKGLREVRFKTWRKRL
jgi:hypothetical protein